MTTQELQVELATIKDMLNKLQITVDRLTILLENTQAQTSMPASETRWLALSGVGAEIWRSIDADAYIDEERSTWN